MKNGLVVSMLYYIQKTGMEMFDVSRVYGLALILDTVAGKTDERIILENFGTYYLIHGPEINETVDLEKDKAFLGLFEPSDGWSRIFLTITMAPTIDIENEKRKTKVLSTIKEKTSQIQVILSSRLSKIVGNYSDIRYVPEISAKKKTGFDTIYQSIEVTAAKGFRRPVRDGYEEGGQVYAPLSDLSIAYLGGAHFIHWVRGDNTVGILPAPLRVIYKNHLELQKILKEKYPCRVSINTVLAHYAVSVAESMRKQKANQTSYADRYSSLIYNAMTKTGNQWKPTAGGLFPIDFLQSLVTDDVNVSEGILGIWDALFRNARDGREDLALSLADFISRPTTDSIERHLSIHLRYSLSKELQKRKIFLPIYHNNQMTEVLKYVKD